MIKKITKTFRYNQELNKFITSLGTLQGHEWDEPSKGLVARTPQSAAKNAGMEGLKKFIRKKLDVAHRQKSRNIVASHCAYCGLRLNVTSNDEIEHFVPKAARHAPEWMFTPVNLLLACHLCNGPKRKGNKNVVNQ